MVFSISPSDLSAETGFEGEVSRSSLPAYARLQAAEHRAHERELAAIVSGLPVAPQDRVLDCPCGDGFFSRLLADRLGAGGALVATDISTPFLKQCATRFEGAAGACHVTQGDAYCLPFRDGVFDFAWCAESFMSLSEPVRALAEIRRVLRVGGMVAVLESDDLHDLVLPWPASLELAVHEGRRLASLKEGRQLSRHYVGRHLQDLLCSARFEPVEKSTHAVDRRAPLDEREREFVGLYLEGVWAEVAPVLSAGDARELRRFIDPSSPEYLPAQPDFESTAIVVLFLGRKPAV